MAHIQPITLRNLGAPQGEHEPFASRLSSFGEEAPAAPPPPAITEDDLKAAEQEGYRRGFLDGEREGRQIADGERFRNEKQLAQSLSALAEPIDAMLAHYHAHLRAQKQALPALALAIARKVAGKALEERALLELEPEIAACIETMLGEAHIVVTVHDELAPLLEEHLSARLSHRREPGEVSIIGDGTMPKSDFRIQWASGGAERDTEALWAKVEKLVSDLSDAAARAPDASLDVPEEAAALPAQPVPTAPATPPHITHDAADMSAPAADAPQESAPSPRPISQDTTEF